jgi:type II secretion system protein N
MSRRWLVAAATALVFAASLAVLFPTDAVVRRTLARGTPPGWPAVVFREARLRPSGLVLDDVTLRDTTGAEILHAERVRWRPSYLSLLRGADGLPWHVEAAACNGTGEATVGLEGGDTTVALTWYDADLAACPPLRIAGGALRGRAQGTARLRLAPGGPPVGSGDVELRAAVWRGAGPFALRAEAASVRWRLETGRVVLEALDLRGPDITVTGTGEVRLADPIGESDLELNLAYTFAAFVTAQPLRVAGTLSRPRRVGE